MFKFRFKPVYKHSQLSLQYSADSGL